MHEYKFDPKFILGCLIEIYLSFKGYKEFLEFVVKDERSYRLENFEKVISLKENDKISLDYNSYQDFKMLVQELSTLSAEIKSKEVTININ